MIDLSFHTFCDVVDGVKTAIHHPVTQVGKEAIIAAKNLYKIYRDDTLQIENKMDVVGFETLANESDQALSGSASVSDLGELRSSAGVAHTSTYNRTKKVARVCFLLEMVRFATYIPFAPFKIMGIAACIFGLAGNTLMTKATVEEGMDDGCETKSSMLERVVSVISYSTTAYYMAFLILKTLASASAAAIIITPLVTVFSWESLGFTVLGMTIYVVLHRQEIKENVITGAIHIKDMAVAIGQKAVRLHAYALSVFQVDIDLRHVPI